MNTNYSEITTINDGAYEISDISINPYKSSWEHLLDELKRFDLMLIMNITKDQIQEEQNQFAGMALTAEEILGLLDKDESYWYDESFLSKELEKLNTIIDKRLELSANEGINLALPNISKIYNLSSFEIGCIIICMASELDRKYEKVYAYLQNDITAKRPTIDLVLQILCKTDEEKISIRHMFDLQAPLMRFFMESNCMDNQIPMINRLIKLDDWVVNYLLDIDALDTRLMQVANMISVSDTKSNLGLNLTEDNIVRFVKNYWPKNDKNKKQIFYFYGPCGSGKIENAMAACKNLRLPIILADMEKIIGMDMVFTEILRLIGRQVMLQNAALCIENFHILLTDDGRYQTKINLLMEMLMDYAPLTFLIGEYTWNPTILTSQTTFIKTEFLLPTGNERKIYWENSRLGYKLADEVDLQAFSEKFQFTRGQIEAALSYGENLAVWNGSVDGIISEKDLYYACYAQSNRKLNILAPKINTIYSWDMLVLPPDQMSQLREICNHLKYSSLVYNDWGFDKRLSIGKGLNVLFCGPPGSGKTMAAEVIANELNLEIYKIDVSQIVSKYVGETEKNLSKIFDEAQTSNAILFFDEADALFGKRSEVKDAHDRYANIETSYLLQKMEEYRGVVILATNLNQNIDEAFLRRLHFNVEFPFPEKKQREQMWIGMFPTEAPLNKDIDYDFLAEKFVLAGGNIKNIALNAAFYAANDSCSIGMKQILLSAKREYKKLGKAFLKSDFDPYYQLIEVI